MLFQQVFSSQLIHPSTMSPKYKLTYLNSRRFAEIVRLLFAQAGVEYEDIRIEEDKWAELKPTMPFGKVPVLEIDGTIISESKAIARYMAREHGLAGKDNLEAAKCDMLVDAFSDLFNCDSSALVLLKLATDKAPIYEYYAAEALPPFLAFLNPILEKNHAGVGFLVGDKLTWADIVLAYGLNQVDLLEPVHGFQILEEYPLIKAYIDRILALPNIQTAIQIAKRQVTEF